jgi:hypothetical protein
MMLAAVETVAKAYSVWAARRHDLNVAAKATAGESLHAASPRERALWVDRNIAISGPNERKV